MSTDVQHSIERTRAIRAALVLAVVLNAVALAACLSVGSPLAIAAAVAICACLALVVAQTRLIATLRRRERELNRPRMTAEDYRHLREMEIELGWEPSELPTGMTEQTPQAKGTGTLTSMGTAVMPGAASLSGPGTLSAPMPGPGGRWRPMSELPGVKPAEPSRCDCGKCGEASREFDEQLREQIIASQGIPPARVVPDEAAEHFAALARVGREHCLSYCPVCLYRLFGPLPDGWPAASMRKWLEENWGWG